MTPNRTSFQSQGRRIILHAGTHKTGTTALQEFASQNCAALADLGIFYPHSGQRDHHEFAHLLAGEGTNPASDAQHMLQQWMQRAPPGTDILISSEAMWRHEYGDAAGWLDRRTSYLKRLRDCMPDNVVTPLLVFRRPDDYVRALYLERIWRTPRGVRQSFVDYRSEIANRMARYHDNTMAFRDVIGEPICQIYSDLAQNGLFTSFFDALDVDVRSLPEPGTVRPSLLVPDAMALNFAKLSTDIAWTRRSSAEFLALPQVRSALDSKFPRMDWDIWESNDARRSFLTELTPQVEALGTSFFSGRKDLFPPLEDHKGQFPAFSDALKSELSEAAAELIARKRTTHSLRSGLRKLIKPR